jgi:radical SAM superfamily enzyme YgiQ (UPF0313 family)
MEPPKEINVIVKDWRNIDISFGLIYPNIYSLGMSSYSIRLLYSLINAYRNIVCERIFLPKKLNYPATEDYQPDYTIRSIENGILPQNFDILGFSIHYENDFRNILWLLEKSNIPLLYRERQVDRKEKALEYPLIIGGGPAITSNPQPLSKIFDIFFIGDAEPVLENFFQVFLNYKINNLEFNRFLRDLTEIEGLYIPLLKNKVKREVVENLDKSEELLYQLIPNSKNVKGAFEQSFFIEVNRGCPFQCKFCISSFHNNPFRNQSFKNIIDSIDKAVKSYDFDSISLIGSCISYHPRFIDICKHIISKKKRLLIPSIRIDHLTSEIIKILEEGKTKTITIAPETGSEKLRFNIGKKITNEEIYHKITMIRESAIKNIKMYFLIGLPSETDDDIESIIVMVKSLNELGFDKNALRISINPMVPKLNTPFQNEIDYYLKDNLSILSERFQRIKEKLAHLKSVNLKIRDITNFIKTARLQTLFSLGNDEVSEILIDYYHNGATFGALRRIFNQRHFSMDEYLLRVKKGYNPWIIENSMI